MNNSSQAHAPSPPRYRSRLHQALAEGIFTVTAEVVPPRGATLNGVRRMARVLRDWVVAANVTDGQSAMARMASWAGCLGLMQEDVEPVMQLQCRDRNRIALQADLLGASAVGIPNMLLLTGDHQRFGDHPESKGVFDLDSTQLVWLARTLRDDHRLLSGSRLSVSPRWFIGAVENPSAAPQEYRPERAGKKIAAGAQFIQTQLIFDVPVFERFMRRICELGLDRRCYFLAGVGAITSVGALHFMQHLPGLVIPEDFARRLREVPEHKLHDEGLKICAETIQRIREIPGVSGVHISASRWEELVPDVLKLAGVPPHGIFERAAGFGNVVSYQAAAHG